MLSLEARIVKAQYKQYTLKYPLQEYPDSTTYTTDDSDVICIARSLNTIQQRQSYQKQKNLLIELRHTNIIGLVDCHQDGKLGYLFLQNCFNNLKKYLQTTQTDIQEGLILKIINDVLKGLEVLHVNATAHRNVSLDSIVQNEDGAFKLSQLNHTSKSIIVSNSNRNQIGKNIETETSQLYRAPEQLNLNTGDEIGTKVDIFALGIVVYLLCYKRFPFESRSSVSFRRYIIPQNPKYSKTLKSIIEECLTPNPKQRPTSEQLLSKFAIKTRNKKFSINYDNKIEMELVELDQRLNVLKNWSHQIGRKYSEEIDFNLFVKIKKVFNQLTTKTQGWIISFIQNDDSLPSSKYDRYIISKCWEKRHKVNKVYEIIQRQVNENSLKGYTNIKALILIHNLLRKGPKQAINSQVYPTPISICQKIYTNWSERGKQQKNSFISIVIQTYALIIKQKIRIGSKYSMFIEGNYCLQPFFSSQQEQKILSITFLITLRNFLDRLVTFHECLLSENIFKDAQKAVILSVVDQEYCLVSLLVHLYSTFKQSTNYIEQSVDNSVIICKINDFDKRFQATFEKLSQLFERTNNNLANLLNGKKLSLNISVIKHIIDIPILGKKKIFDIKNFLNYEIDIFGIMIPKPYEQVTQHSDFLRNSLTEEGCQNYMEMQFFTRKSTIVPSKFMFDTVTTTQIKKSQKSEKKFEQFDFQTKNKEAEERKRRKSNFQFTHQNLNKDFSAESKIKNQQSIKQFLSLGSDIHLSKSVFQPDTKIVPNQSSDLLQLQQTQKNAFIKGPKSQRKPSITINSSIQQPKQLSQHQIPIIESKSPRSIKLQSFITEQVIKNANQYLISASELKLMEEIGRGHSSEVFKGQWRGQTIAVKKIKLLSQNLISEFKRELATTIKLRPHPNLVTLIGVSEEKDYFYIINQYCTGGNLFNLLHKSNVPISWASKIQLAKQIAHGMMFLHSNVPSIVHRDLKSLNILLVDEYNKQSDNLKVKIGDFGLSREISDVFMTGVLGTYHWMAPQIFNNHPYSIKADVYSFGIVLWEIIVRPTPYQNIQSVQALIKYVGIQNGRPDLSMVSSKCPVELRLLMMKCWSMEPKDRPTFKEIIAELKNITL